MDVDLGYWCPAHFFMGSFFKIILNIISVIGRLCYFGIIIGIGGDWDGI